MNNRRHKSLHESKKPVISAPESFKHLYHVKYDFEEVSFSGIPPGWRKNIIGSTSQSQSFAAIPFVGSFRRKKELSSLVSRRLRFSSTTVKEDSPFDPSEFVAKFSNPKITARNPLELLSNVTVKQEFGAFSVFYGNLSGVTCPMAFKCLNLDTTISRKELSRELEFLSTHSHDNIVKFVEAFVWDTNALIVFSDDNDTTLDHIISTTSNISYTDPQSTPTCKITQEHACFILFSILKGLEYIHLNQYIHRDIKSDNILVASNGLVRITDFGACIKADDSLITSEIVGTPYWMAPEMAAKEPYNFAVDVWSVGCILIEMFQSCPPFYIFPPHEFGPLAAPFLKCCLAFKRSERANASQLVIHPFLNSKCSQETLADLHLKVALL